MRGSICHEKNDTERNPVPFTIVTSIVVDDEVYINILIMYQLFVCCDRCDLVPFTTLQGKYLITVPITLTFDVVNPKIMRYGYLQGILGDKLGAQSNLLLKPSYPMYIVFGVIMFKEIGGLIGLPHETLLKN